VPAEPAGVVAPSFWKSQQAWARDVSLKATPAPRPPVPESKLDGEKGPRQALDTRGQLSKQSALSVTQWPLPHYREAPEQGLREDIADIAPDDVKEDEAMLVVNPVVS